MPALSPGVLLHAKTIWNYHHLGHDLEPADIILVLGSHDTRVAEHAARLFLDGWAPLMVMSGGLGNFTRGVWTRPEAEIFKDIAIKMGVPAGSILTEPDSTNSGENIQFTRALLQGKNVNPSKLILVQKPYMERRVFATFQKVWPGKQAIVTSPPIGFESYPTLDIPMKDVINIMVGDLHRIIVYPALGFQSTQDVPEQVMVAMRALIAGGFTAHLYKDAGGTVVPFE